MNCSLFSCSSFDKLPHGHRRMRRFIIEVLSSAAADCDVAMGVVASDVLPPSSALSVSCRCALAVLGRRRSVVWSEDDAPQSVMCTIGNGDCGSLVIVCIESVEPEYCWFNEDAGTSVQNRILNTPGCQPCDIIMSDGVGDCGHGNH